MTSGQPALPRSTWLLLAGLTLGWGVNWPIMKIALEHVPVWTFRSLSVAGGTAGMFFIAWRAATSCCRRARTGRAWP
jgi:drug/metabolite transporter (DMT)-like permease